MAPIEEANAGIDLARLDDEERAHFSAAIDQNQPSWIINIRGRVRQQNIKNQENK